MPTVDDINPDYKAMGIMVHSSKIFFINSISVG